MKVWLKDMIGWRSSIWGICPVPPSQVMQLELAMGRPEAGKVDLWCPQGPPVEAVCHTGESFFIPSFWKPGSSVLFPLSPLRQDLQKGSDGFVLDVMWVMALPAYRWDGAVLSFKTLNGSQTRVSGILGFQGCMPKDSTCACCSSWLSEKKALIVAFSGLLPWWLISSYQRKATKREIGRHEQNWLLWATVVPFPGPFGGNCSVWVYICFSIAFWFYWKWDRVVLRFRLTTLALNPGSLHYLPTLWFRTI